MVVFHLKMCSDIQRIVVFFFNMGILEYNCITAGLSLCSLQAALTNKVAAPLDILVQDILTDNIARHFSQPPHYPISLEDILGKFPSLKL